MNADTPRLTTNTAGVRHLNSVHGVYLEPDTAKFGRDLLPLASLNSATLLSAELVGRSYGGGILKIEPREADDWLMPSHALVQGQQGELRKVKEAVATLLAAKDLAGAVDLVDRALLIESGTLGQAQVAVLRAARDGAAERRRTRGSSGKRTD